MGRPEFGCYPCSNEFAYSSYCRSDQESAAYVCWYWLWGILDAAEDGAESGYAYFTDITGVCIHSSGRR